MWFRNVYLKSLRDARVAIFGWGIGLGLLMYLVLAAISKVLGTTPAEKAAVQTLAQSFAWVAEPIQVTTPGGYATWKYGFTVLVMAIWPLLIGARMLRGDEERGVMDALLALPESRVRVATQKLAAMWTALLAMGLLIGLLTYAGSQTANAGVSLGNSLVFGLNLALACGVFGGIALLISQFTYTPGAAAGITGGLLALSIVIDMLHRVIPGTEWISRLSPVYYYNLSKPLIASYGVNPGAMLVLLAISVVTSGVAIWLFMARDVGSPVALPGWLRLPERAMSPARALPVNDWSLRSVYTRGLAMVAVPTFWWTVGIAGFAAFMVTVAKQTEKSLAALYSSSPILSQEISKVGGGDVATNSSLLSFLFVFLPLLLMAFAVTQASRWASDEESGQLELPLTSPQSRLSVVLARFGALATATVAISVITLIATALSAAGSSFSLDGGKLVGASLGMIPLGLLVAALGYLFAGWLRTAVETGILSFLLVIWFFITFIGPSLNWPGAVLRVSALYYYGTPLVNGLPIGDTLIIIAVATAALALAVFRFTRKDIAR